MNRRQLLSAGARAGAALGIAKGITNTVVGYGHLGFGEHLAEQPLAELAEEDRPTFEAFRHSVDGWDFRGHQHTIEVRPRGGSWSPATERELPADIAVSVDRVRALRDGRFAYRFLPRPDFFALIDDPDHDLCPAVVAALRGRNRAAPDPAAVRSFAGCEPDAVAALVQGLADGFARTTRYDVGRYAVGAVEDNLLPFKTGLRARLRPELSFTSLNEDDQTSMFCGEYAVLANRAFAAVDPAAQTPPVTGLRVVNRRHKHVYNGLASAIATPDGLVVPVTFVDYTDATMYADVRLDGMIEDPINAYDTHHRADRILW